MKKTIEKIALVAQTVIALIVAVICLLMALGNIPTLSTNSSSGKVVLVFVCIFSGLYLAFAIYNLYVAFSDRSVLRYVMLTADNDKSTSASGKVLKKIAVSDSALVEGIKVRRLQVRPDEKFGFKMRVDVDVDSNEVNLALEKYRCLLVDSYINILGLKFSSIDFRIRKVTTTYTPDVSKAQKQAEAITNKTKQSAEQPLHEEHQAEQPQPEQHVEAERVEVETKQEEEQPAVDVTEDIVVTVEDAEQSEETEKEEK